METTWPHALLMLLLGLPCGVVAVTAGGGVTLGVPLLMLTGVSAAISVVAVKVALWASFLTGSLVHRRKRPELAIPPPWWIWPMCLLGSVLGAQWLTMLDPQHMRGIVLALLIASTAGTIFATRPRKGAPQSPTAVQRVAGHVAVFGLAIYSGFFGAGYGVFLIWALVALHGHSPGSAAALGTRLALIASSASVAVFLWRGVVPWGTTIPLGIGCAIGGVLGGRAANALGDRFIKISTWVVSILVAAKLVMLP